MFNPDWLAIGLWAAGLAVCAVGIHWRLRHVSKPLWREKPFSIKKPFPVHGVPDLVWQEKDGTLTIHDLKIRNSARVFASDLIQLSVYRMLVARSTGRTVNPWGVIRARSDGAASERLLRVKLMDEGRLERLYRRYCAILDGSEFSNQCGNKAYCGRCSFNGDGCFPQN